MQTFPFVFENVVYTPAQKNGVLLSDDHLDQAENLYHVIMLHDGPGMDQKIDPVLDEVLPVFVQGFNETATELLPSRQVVQHVASIHFPSQRFFQAGDNFFFPAPEVPGDGQKRMEFYFLNIFLNFQLLFFFLLFLDFVGDDLVGNRLRQCGRHGDPLFENKVEGF